MSLGGSARASIWFDRPAPSCRWSYAAQVNAVMSDAAASDDSDLRTIVHCGTPLVATALAAAEHHGGSGEEVLAAIVVGYEAAGRIIDAMPGFRERGFHGSHAAIFSATVAAARLLHLDAEQTTHAIALTATSTERPREGGRYQRRARVPRRDGDDEPASRRCGRRSAATRAEERILEMKLGFFEALGGVDGTEAAARATRDLGASWDIVTDMAVKLVPGGHPYHALAEAAANAAREGKIAAAEDRQHHRVAPGHDRAHRPIASQGPGRHGAQPGLFPRRRRRRPRLLMGPRDRRRRSPTR